MGGLTLMTVALLLRHSAGSVMPVVHSSIMGGEDAPAGRWPWMVYLHLSTGNRPWECGGALLNKEWVLTAAHCVIGSRAKSSSVRMGTHTLKGSSGVKSPVSRFVVHPDYDDRAYENDIALLKLSKAANFADPLIKPVNLSAEESFGPESECWVTGWGYTKENVPLAGNRTLQQLQVPLLDWDICKDVFPHLLPTMLCAGDMKGGKDACQGDSGGPLVCPSAQGFVQVGIVSTGNGCGSPGYPGVYTRVNQYLDFINKTIHSDY